MDRLVLAVSIAHYMSKSHARCNCIHYIIFVLYDIFTARVKLLGQKLMFIQVKT